MALVFAGVSPHTPILVPTIGKDALKMIETTKNSLQALEQELYTTHPDILVVISPHGNSIEDAIAMNMESKYSSNFEEFGDLTTKMEWKPATMLIDRFREDFIGTDHPLALISNIDLDYGTAVPLYHLTQHLPDIKVAPVCVSSDLDLKTHYEFGRAMKSEIQKSTERIAVIASADLSHRAGENSPQGLSPKGVALDEKIQEIMRDGNIAGVLDIDEAWAQEAAACGLKPLALLLGMLEEINIEIEVLSYEKPLGVGYMVAAIHVS